MSCRPHGFSDCLNFGEDLMDFLKWFNCNLLKDQAIAMKVSFLLELWKQRTLLRECRIKRNNTFRPTSGAINEEVITIMKIGNGKEIIRMIDTSSPRSITNIKCITNFWCYPNPFLNSVNGSKINFVGAVNFRNTINQTWHICKFLVSDNLTFDAITGRDSIVQANAIISYSRGPKMRILENTFPIAFSDQSWICEQQHLLSIEFQFIGIRPSYNDATVFLRRSQNS
ncbi:hypothetical protein RF11_15611 [Thelohanellus kitauei]|uniref:Uncharacterized protein n=1 Tax=Thelohanellus kitauei TaxID=669202 RepID=A0A0C2J7X2_THEKT|nr:hypothetical protein RF11_15611 [Thelohanellus kitauei]